MVRRLERLHCLLKDVRHLEDGNREAPELLLSRCILPVDRLAHRNGRVVVRHLERPLHGRNPRVTAVDEASQSVFQREEVDFPHARRIFRVDIRHAALRRQLDAGDIRPRREHLLGQLGKVLRPLSCIGNHVGQCLRHRKARAKVLLELIRVDLGRLRTFLPLHDRLILHDVPQQRQVYRDPNQKDSRSDDIASHALISFSVMQKSRPCPDRFFLYPKLYSKKE